MVPIVTQTIVARLTDVNDAPYVLGSRNSNFEPAYYSILRIKVLPLFSILSMKMGILLPWNIFPSHHPQFGAKIHSPTHRIQIFMAPIVFR